MKKILEAVPNFSEGRDLNIINEIVSTIKSVQGIDVKNVDIGYNANRTVVTFIGEVEAVLEAAFKAVAKAGKLIDMRNQSGCHPRMGATDVLPLVPIKGITLEETVVYARDLAKRIFDKLSIPCYCYEAAAYTPERQNLAYCRKGEYESLKEKIANPILRPDFAPATYNETVAKSGATNVGARKILLAVNFNLNTKDKELAHKIACQIRESGYKGKKGLLKSCKAIGWYIEEYGFAQVSMNITDIEIAPLHIVYETVSKLAEDIGLEVTGTEIIGLVPSKTLIQAGQYFAKDSFMSDFKAMDYAVQKMNFNQIEKFNILEKIL